MHTGQAMLRAHVPVVRNKVLQIFAESTSFVAEMTKWYHWHIVHPG